MTNRKQKLTATQKSYLVKFASGELTAESKGYPGAVAICRNLTKRGLLAADGTLTEAGRQALATGTYST